MKRSNGETVMIMTLSMIKISPMKCIMEIHSGIEMILMNLFVRKVSQKTKKKLNGETVMMNLAKVKVNPIKTYA